MLHNASPIQSPSNGDRKSERGKFFEFLPDELLLACRKIQKVFYAKISNEEKEDAIDSIKSSSNDENVRTAVRIIKDVMPMMFTQFLNRQVGEAHQIIELLRPFLLHCLSSALNGVKYEWMTFHLKPHPTFPSSNQIMMPDFVIFVEPRSSMTFELCFVEVKRKGNHYKGTKETDLVKIGKQLKISLDKLMMQKVSNPEVVGIIIKEDHVATVFRMDLEFNGQYRMIKISELNFIGRPPMTSCYFQT